MVLAPLTNAVEATVAIQAVAPPRLSVTTTGPSRPPTDVAPAATLPKSTRAVGALMVSVPAPSSNCTGVFAATAGTPPASTRAVDAAPASASAPMPRILGILISNPLNDHAVAAHRLRAAHVT